MFKFLEKDNWEKEKYNNNSNLNIKTEVVTVYT